MATQEIKLGIQDGMPDVKSGTRVFTSLKVTDAPDGTPVFIPLIIVKGEKEGPTLLVDGCHHGAEVEGTEAIVRLARSLDTKALKGTFIGVPVLNVAAFMARERFNPLDPKDMNRLYPGKENGSVTEQIVYVYYNQVVSQADCVISNHSGGDRGAPLLHVVCTPVPEGKEKSFEVAKAFGLEIIRTHTAGAADPPFPGMLNYHVTKRGVPAIITESGARSDDYANREFYVSQLEKGFTNVMKHLGMLDGKPELPKRQLIVDQYYFNNKRGGFWTPKVMMKESVKKGQLLGVTSCPGTGASGLDTPPVFPETLKVAVALAFLSP